MKVLLTDFDGCLKSVASIIYNNRLNLLGLSKTPTHESFDPIACSNLEYVLEELPDVQVVVTSNWRKDHTLAALQKIFATNHILPSRMIDMTPVREDEDRSKEIHMWLSAHPEVTDFVVIDDSEVDLYRDRQVLVNSDNGFCFTDAEKVIEMLGGKDEEKDKEE